MTNEELLIKARKDYPNGTKFICPNNFCTFTINKTTPNTYQFYTDNNIDGGRGSGFLYYKGVWAKIVSKPKKIIQIY